MIAHYIAETLNMTENLITLNESFSIIEPTRKIELNIIVGNYNRLSLEHKSTKL